MSGSGSGVGVGLGVVAAVTDTTLSKRISELSGLLFVGRDILLVNMFIWTRVENLVHGPLSPH